MTRTRVRTTVVAAALLGLSGCSAPSSSGPIRSSDGTSTHARSSLSGRDIGVQLRPVLDVERSASGQCPATPSPTADAAATTGPITACGADGTTVYSLGPAAVTGTQWESMRVADDTVSGSTQIDALLDPGGSSALTQVTGELFSNDEPQNQLAIYLDGEVQAAPSVQQPIYGGALVLGAGLTHEEAQALVYRLTGGA